MAQTDLKNKRWRQIKQLQTLTLLAILLAWEFLARSGLLYEGVVPTLPHLFASLWSEISSRGLYQHLGITLAEIVAGFLIATVTGVIVGVALGSRRFVSQVAEPYLTSLATTPKIVFLPIVMLMFGIGPESKVTVGALSGFFPIALSTMAGTLTVRPVLINVGKVFNLSRLQMLTKIYLPSLVGPIIRGMRLGLGVTIIGVLLAEIKMSNSGLGFLAIEYYNNYNIANMYSILIIIFVLAVAINALMSVVSQRFDRS